MKHVVLSDEPVELVSVAAQDNVALNRRAFQSKIWAKTFPASLAVDGNRNGNFAAGRSCTATDWELSPWWAVDMGTTRHVDAVCISNRVDGFSKFVKRPVMYYLTVIEYSSWWDNYGE
jgi:hypothetical protein